MTSERTLKLVLEYEGTAYFGWQLQPDRPTIQGILEQTLQHIFGAPLRVHGAGRTDAGVHARGQVAHLQTVSKMTCEELHRALNALLPRDIGLVSLEAVPDTFHARKSARAKCYTYQILNRPHRSVFDDRFCWHLPKALDWNALEQASRQLIGYHDFRAFAATDCSVKTTYRDLFRCDIRAMPSGLYRLEFVGSGFLKHMVRTMVGTLVAVGQNRLKPTDLLTILDRRDRKLAGKTAPARGLCLEWVDYQAEPALQGHTCISEEEE